MEVNDLAVDLCARKAKFMAYSAMSGKDARIMTAILIYAFTYIHAAMTMTIAFGKINNIYRTKLIIFNLSTIICSGIATCIATYYFTVQRQFYCTSEFAWNEWDKEWAFTGIMLSIPGCVMALDWLFIFSHVLWERDVPEYQADDFPMQWSILFLGAIGVTIYGVGLTILAALSLVFWVPYGFVIFREWAIKRLKALGKRAFTALWAKLKRASSSCCCPGKRRKQSSADIEQSQPLASKTGPVNIKRYGAVDQSKQEKQARLSEGSGKSDSQSDRAPSYRSEDPNATDA